MRHGERNAEIVTKTLDMEEFCAITQVGDEANRLERLTRNQVVCGIDCVGIAQLYSSSVLPLCFPVWVMSLAAPGVCAGCHL